MISDSLNFLACGVASTGETGVDCGFSTTWINV